jgi:hypothetical protein
VSAGVNNTPLTEACQIVKTARRMTGIATEFVVNHILGTGPLFLYGAAKIRCDAEIRARLDIRFVANLQTQE